MLFLSKSGEIIKPVNARFNRMVVWNSSIDYQLKQPDFDSFQQEYSIIIKLTKDAKKLKDEVAYIKVEYDDRFFSCLVLLGPQG